MNWMVFVYFMGIVIGVLMYLIIVIVAESSFLDFMQDLFPDMNYRKNKSLLSNKWAPGSNSNQQEKVK